MSSKIATQSGSFQYLKDSLDSIIDIAGNDGTKIQHYVYSAYGKLLGIQNATAADITNSPTLNTLYSFAGRELDSETGYYYNRARYYDPTIGRLLQEDPAPGRMQLPRSIINKYVYAANNPLNLSNPTGKSWLGIDWGTVLVAVAIGVASAFTDGLAGVAIGGLLGGGALGAIGGAVAGAVAGAIMGGVIGGIGSVLQGHSFGEGVLAGAVMGATSGLFAGALAVFNSSQANALNNFRPSGGDQLAYATNSYNTSPGYLSFPTPGCHLLSLIHFVQLPQSQAELSREPEHYHSLVEPKFMELLAKHLSDKN